jgi:kanamycin kinase
VFYLDRDGGMFLKSAPRSTLSPEAEMTAYFFRKGIGPEVLGYETTDSDWLLTRKIPGEDCLYPAYLEAPEKLCDALATALRMLHETDASDCPVSVVCPGPADLKAECFDFGLFRSDPGFSNAEEAANLIRRNVPFLGSRTLIHGDYCLPNVMLDNWKFSGFLDVGGSGLGDRHIDLFWGLWSLGYNLHTDALASRFLDCYGADAVEPELLRTAAAIAAFGQ